MQRLLSAVIVLLVVAAAPAVIKVLTPLKQVIDAEKLIFVLEVTKLDPDTPGATFAVKEDLKGKCGFETLSVNLTGDGYAKKEGHTTAILKRLAPERKLIVFTTRTGKEYVAFAFVEGTWFQMKGTVDADGKAVRWAFLHGEPYFRRTFKGTTAELQDVVEKYVAGKGQPPAPDEKEPAGFGPEAEKPDKVAGDGRHSPLTPSLSPETGARGQNGPPFAVIPSVVLVGPLAILAAIAPGLFAKLAVQLKRWRAFLVAASAASTLAFAYFWARPYLPDSAWFAPQRVAAALVAVPLACLVWAGRRYRAMAAEDPTVTAAPSWPELLWLVGLAGAAGLAVAAVAHGLGAPAVFDPAEPWKELAGVAGGLSVAAWYAGYRRFFAVRGEGPVALSLSGETIALAGFAAVAVFAALPKIPRAIPAALTGNLGDAGESGPKLTDVTVFAVPDAGEVLSGITFDSGKLYFGTLTVNGFRQSGAVYCLAADSGKVLWRFDAGGSLKPVFSTPAVANGRVYVGEGLHTDADRRLFCLDAATGEPTWEKVTASHTEGGPQVVEGKVYFAAGDDGVFCTTTDGAAVWHFDGAAKNLHVDSPVAVAAGRAFFGSGYGTLAALAADARTGNELWRTPQTLRSFGPPLVKARAVYFGLGTGNLIDDLSTEPEDGVPPENVPAGAVVALDPTTGKQLWAAALPKSVHTRLGSDSARVFAACKDGSIYAFARADGKKAWSRQVSTAFTAGVAVLPGGVYAVAADGRAVCLDPATGRVQWVREISDAVGGPVNVMSSAAVHDGGTTRALYVGCQRTTAGGRAAAAVVRITDAVED